MATIITADLETHRRRFALGRNPTWTKTQFNAALQAIEDAMVSGSNVGARTVKTYIGQAVETAAPGVFNAGQKDDLFLVWSLLNARRGGIL